MTVMFKSGTSAKARLTGVARSTPEAGRSPMPVAFTNRSATKTNINGTRYQEISTPATRMVFYGKGGKMGEIKIRGRAADRGNLGKSLKYKESLGLWLIVRISGLVLHVQEVAGSSPAASTIAKFLFSLRFISFQVFRLGEQLAAQTRYLCRHPSS